MIELGVAIAATVAAAGAVAWTWRAGARSGEALSQLGDLRARLAIHEADPKHHVPPCRENGDVRERVSVMASEAASRDKKMDELAAEIHALRDQITEGLARLEVQIARVAVAQEAQAAQAAERRGR